MGGAELSRFIQIAMGSASELEFHLLLARDFGDAERTRFHITFRADYRSEAYAHSVLAEAES
jgi:hypothetical protein